MDDYSRCIYGKKNIFQITNQLCKTIPELLGTTKILSLTMAPVTVIGQSPSRAVILERDPVWLTSKPLVEFAA